MSFMVIAIGTVFLAAAWIMTTSDPYSDLAHRVSEVPPEPQTVEAEPVPLFETAETPADQDPSAAPEDVAGITVPPVGIDDAQPEPLSPTLAKQVPARLPGDLPKTAAAGATPALIGPVQPAGRAAEHALALSEVERRAVQRRLGMSGFDLGTPDGIFGPQTRDAIDAFQLAEGLRGTGYLDEATVTLLIERTEADYAAWAESREQGTKRSRSYRPRSGTRVAEAPLPARRQARERGDCLRGTDGTVLGRQSLGCDLRGFGEGIRGVFTGKLGPSGPAQLEDQADPDR